MLKSLSIRLSIFRCGFWAGYRRRLPKSRVFVHSRGAVGGAPPSDLRREIFRRPIRPRKRRTFPRRRTAWTPRSRCLSTRPSRRRGWNRRELFWPRYGRRFDAAIVGCATFCRCGEESPWAPVVDRHWFSASAWNRSRKCHCWWR